MSTPTPPVTPYPLKTHWPTNWQAARLTGKFIDLVGDPISGKDIVLTPTVSTFTSEATQTIIQSVPRTVVLSADGTLDVLVPATDDPDIQPTGWTYRVEEKFGANRVYYIEALANTVMDLSAIVPTAPSAGISVTRGEVGPIGPPGETGVGVPIGGAAGTVLAKLTDDDYSTVWLQVSQDGTIEGPSAYEVALANGYVGPVETWLRDLQGEQGPPGLTGPQGLKGEKGDQGLPGLNGASGLQGATGKSAYQHAQELGYTGTLAQWLESLRGPAGRGVPSGGAIGQALVKASGTDYDLTWGQATGGSGGMSAYEVAVSNGYTGTEVQWLATLRGPIGPVGAAGPAGSTGATGSTGPVGPIGPVGPAGARGPQGVAGERGPIGATGPMGQNRYQSADGQPFVPSGHIYVTDGGGFPDPPFENGSILFRKVVTP